MSERDTTLATRCPECATIFRARPEQLTYKGGLVRCGHCGAVFNAIAHAVLESEQAAMEPPASSGSDPVHPAVITSAGGSFSASINEAIRASVTKAVVQTQRDIASREGAADTHVASRSPDDEHTEPNNSGTAVPNPVPDIEHNIASPERQNHLASETVDAAREDVTTPASVAGMTPTATTDSLDFAPAQSEDTANQPAGVPASTQVRPNVISAPDYGFRPAPKASASRLSPWTSWPIALLLLLILAAQLAYRYRADIILFAPQLKPHADEICHWLDCRIPLPRHAELMSIETSDLQTDSGNTDVMVLSATLRNRAPFTQSAPALELTLTDTEDKAVLRRVLLPADYLPNTAVAPDPEQVPFNAGSEMSLRVRFDASRIKATGYRLYLFYP